MFGVCVSNEALINPIWGFRSRYDTEGTGAGVQLFDLDMVNENVKIDLGNLNLILLMMKITD